MYVDKFQTRCFQSKVISFQQISQRLIKKQCLTFPLIQFYMVTTFALFSPSTIIILYTYQNGLCSSKKITNLNGSLAKKTCQTAFDVHMYLFCFLYALKMRYPELGHQTVSCNRLYLARIYSPDGIADVRLESAK